jgi:Na+-driven multidrug efflux pump
MSLIHQRYIGEKDGARFQRLGLSLGLAALAIGLVSGAAALFFSDSVFRFFTQDPRTLALLETRTVVLVFIVSFVVGLMTSVPAGMVVAAQQFRFMALACEYC